MSTRKPKIEYYWTTETKRVPISGKMADVDDHKVNWRLKGANGEVMCQSTQGFRDKTDAERSVMQVAHAFYNLDYFKHRHTGPGRKPS